MNMVSIGNIMKVIKTQKHRYMSSFMDIFKSDPSLLYGRGEDPYRDLGGHKYKPVEEPQTPTWPEKPTQALGTEQQLNKNFKPTKILQKADQIRQKAKEISTSKNPNRTIQELQELEKELTLQVFRSGHKELHESLASLRSKIRTRNPDPIKINQKLLEIEKKLQQ